MLIKCPECQRDVSDTAPSCPGCGYVLNAPPAPAKGDALDFPSPSTATQILIEQRIANDGPSAGVAYVLWFFLGLLGVHRFYLGKAGTGVLMLILSITVVGLAISGLWWIVDAFLIPDMIRQKRTVLRQQLAGVAGGTLPANPYVGSGSYYDPTTTR
jgi:TM2 domain-containing membrane protein YozV